MNSEERISEETLLNEFPLRKVIYQIWGVQSIFSCHWLQVNKLLKEISLSLTSEILSQRSKEMTAVASVGHVRSCDAISINLLYQPQI